ncbi:MAG: type II toxin-antitoxin system VapC family toxin, partial [Deferrisomatales bacterium]
MRFLLDTHAWLWWVSDDPRLSKTARAAIADETNEVFVSAASAWEISTKHRIGKLGELPQAFTRFAQLVAADGFQHLPVDYLHG